MRWGCIKAALLIGFAVATAGAASAQQRQVPPAQPSIMNEEEDTPPPSSQSQAAKPARGRADTAAPTLETDPNLDQADQLAPSQIRQPMPAAVAEPTGNRPARSVARGTEAMVEPGTSERSSLPAKQYTVACRGVFGKDSNHGKLAMAFQSRNVALTQVDSASGSKVMASVLFAKDPKRRLEVWWSNPANRTDTHLIVINGQSDWSAPGQLRLGLTLPQLEQLNGKPFKLSGFDKNNVATLTNWNGGGLAAIAGGCKVGISLRAALTAPASALSALPADREFTSTDAALRAVNPMVSEILVAY
jgi:hypothetical protein